ncbi:MAG: glutamate--tRNA ligase [Bacteroidetes bacterium]|nr:glutamate--tRNA ligase [Rhodothermia bacterium]MCS7155915.1 glutamate--tRNA ligase [Bacteroidota bacterium]MCX7905921.1 glutamate--tRNA ligase [Bacteroidota bacterium]MDW8138112.1 glutamate--tRNA ligase [Bacteroidota bacterium]MDW8285796.1 glutamate--tRNA ligase [Bacteroidota bacterium]
MSVRVRFAPSPTGLLHIGGLRTALYNYLFARHHGGRFILRIEDTDQSRYVEGAEADIIRSLRWAGLDYDEGPDVGGPYGPYRQSERSELYRRHAEELVEKGFAYYAFDTPEELEAMRERLQRAGNPSPKYNPITRLSMKNSLTLPEQEVRERLRSGQPYVIRLKVPRHETIRFYDEIRGWVAFESEELDDQVLLKSDGLPTYHLANVVDDHYMGITHVIRGEEWLSSTPKHILLYRYFGWEPPKMAHLPLILNPQGGKLSKRSAAELGIPVNVRDYIEAGFLPEAVVNFLAFLGWNPGDDRELMSLPELVEAFSLARVVKSGAVFNFDKLKWYNQQYIRRKPDSELVEAVRRELERRGLPVPEERYLRGVVQLMKERVEFIHEFVTFSRYFFEDPTEYAPEGIRKHWKEDTPALLRAYLERLQRLAEEAFTPERVEAELRALATEHGVAAARLIHPTRLALTGMTFGPGLFDLMALLGRERCLRRLRRALEAIPIPEQPATPP